LGAATLTGTVTTIAADGGSVTLRGNARLLVNPGAVDASGGAAALYGTSGGPGTITATVGQAQAAGGPVTLTGAARLASTAQTVSAFGGLVSLRVFRNITVTAVLADQMSGSLVLTSPSGALAPGPKAALALNPRKAALTTSHTATIT
jgi:hypothetical protein